MDKDSQYNDWSSKWLVLLTKLQAALWTKTAGRRRCPSAKHPRKWHVHLAFISVHGIIIAIAVMINVMIICIPWDQQLTEWVDRAMKLTTSVIRHDWFWKQISEPQSKMATISWVMLTVGWPHLFRDLRVAFRNITKVLLFFEKEPEAEKLCFMQVTQEVHCVTGNRLEMSWLSALGFSY